jgi:soluble lytic murein transglycosylase-like protein
LDDLFAQYGNEYGVDPEKLKKIAYCESHYDPAAASGPYLGMYQYLASTWTSTRTAMGLNGDPALRANAEESIRTTAWKIAQGGIGAWPVCGKK